MAHTIQEIKNSMTDKFMQDANLRSIYSISGDATWDNTFSPVSIENMLIYIVSVCAYSLEVLFDAFCNDVNEQIAQNIVPTVRWYHTQAMKFQYGDALEYDEQAEKFQYPEVDESKKMVRYCAVKDCGGSIQMLVSGDEGGKPSVLSNAILNAFKSYINSIKIAGVILDVKSLSADNIRISAIVQIDPQIINTDGSRISDGKFVVVDAINSYLANILYGGTFNKTKCVDAMQNVEGVLDVTLSSVKAKAASVADYSEITNNNYTATAGCFISDNLKSSISYVV